MIYILSRKKKPLEELYTGKQKTFFSAPNFPFQDPLVHFFRNLNIYHLSPFNFDPTALRGLATYFPPNSCRTGLKTGPKSILLIRLGGRDWGTERGKRRGGWGFFPLIFFPRLFRVEIGIGIMNYAGIF